MKSVSSVILHEVKLKRLLVGKTAGAKIEDRQGVTVLAKG
jgi:hypothetical protein